MFNHVDLNLPSLEREHIDGVRYYSIPNEDELVKLVSITSVTSHFNKEIFVNWRKKIGDEKANRITKAATVRGTDMHTLTENYLDNIELPKVPTISEFLFKIAKSLFLSKRIFVFSSIIKGRTICINKFFLFFEFSIFFISPGN